jgi:hypothetical protein
MKLTHILLLLAAAGLAVLVWRSSQGGPEGISGSGPASKGGGSSESGAAVELGAVPAGRGLEAATSGGAGERTAADLGAPDSSTQDGAKEGVTEGPKGEPSELVRDPSIADKYRDTDGQGRRAALNMLERRLESGKGLNPKDGGLRQDEVERLVAEMEWLKDNLDP